MSDRSEDAPRQDKTAPTTDLGYSRKKLSAHFVDDITSIAISPNGACRLYFATFSATDDGRPLRIDSELITTRATLQKLSEALRNAIRQTTETSERLADAPEEERTSRGLFRGRH